MVLKVAAITTTRADWGLLSPVLSILRDDERFELEIICSGQHFFENEGSLGEIIADGFGIDYRIPMNLSSDDSPAALSEAMGILTKGVGDVLRRSSPDLFMILGDRYEVLAAALSASVAKVPIAHLCGGDVTEGAIDDSIRHAITKLAFAHFPTNEESARRIVQMGEDPARVFNVGSTGIDRIVSTTCLSRSEFMASVGLIDQAKNFVVTFHPETLFDDPVRQAQNLLEALDRFTEAGILFTGSNADSCARAIDSLILDYVSQRDNAVFCSTLGSARYFSALKYCDVVIGNSSSGIMEAPSFKIPTVNIGSRQDRRIRAESIVDCESEASEIFSAIRSALSLDCSKVKNPYGSGTSAQLITDALTTVFERKPSPRKSFLDIKYDH